MLRVLVIAESEADQRIVCGLADRVAIEQRGISDDAKANLQWLNETREWTGVVPGSVVLCWRDIKHLAKDYRPGQLRTMGFRQGKSKGEDTEALHKAFILAESMLHSVRTAIVSRDLDKRAPAAREASIDDVATKVAARGWNLVLAIANHKIEAWLLNGFEPKSKPESDALANLKLGFDPITASHRLDAQDDNAKKSAKRVCDVLCEADPRFDYHERREVCWSETALDILLKRGKESGLTDYLNDVANKLVPLLKAAPK